MRTLVILEVSRKQDYIFSAKELRVNVRRSQEIRFVTETAFFADVYDKWNADNLVYSGGGHTILEFGCREEARDFVCAVTEAALHRFPDIELFAKIMEYDDSVSAGENLRRLSAALEKKKSRRQASFRQVSLGIEDFDGASPVRVDERQNAKPDDEFGQIICAPQGWRYPNDFRELVGDDNFLAVVHIDGNSMGSRVNTVYERSGDRWDDCRKGIRCFSESVQSDFEQAFGMMTGRLIENIAENDVVAKIGDRTASRALPLRPVIIAGDDVCFVTAGSLGLECARVFLESLSTLHNEFDGQSYAACAGVVMVHSRYPFFRAYQLSEQLCSNAKRFGASRSGNCTVSAIDWHIEFGQLQDSLSDIRMNYIAQDGCHIEMRPVSVLDINAQSHGQGDEYDLRSYGEFIRVINAIRNEYRNVPRGKLKQLRNALKQGEIETRFYFSDKQICGLLEATLPEKEKASSEIIRGGNVERNAFVEIDGVKRCMFFDAIELIDHFIAFDN